MSPDKRGRPPEWDEVKITSTHRMTPTAHNWIRKNKNRIELLARNNQLFLRLYNKYFKGSEP